MGLTFQMILFTEAELWDELSRKLFGKIAV